MRPAAFWSSVIVAGFVLAICLIVFEATATWTVGWVGLYLILAALASRPRPWTFEPGDDGEEP